MATVWIFARKPGKSGLTDAIWSFAVGVGGVLAAILYRVDVPGGRRLLVGMMIAIWSLRLGTHILSRATQGHDDPRYLALRQEWGADWDKRLFRFLQVQALAAFLLLIPVLAALSNRSAFPAWSDLAALALYTIAVIGEAVADRQLRRFGANRSNRVKVMDRGLWAFSRHPNYFFEWLGWWSFVLIAIGPDFAITWGWASLLGPALMYWLLVHASGIPPLEQHMLESRGDSFRRYMARTNAFFPGPRKA